MGEVYFFIYPLFSYFLCSNWLLVSSFLSVPSSHTPHCCLPPSSSLPISSPSTIPISIWLHRPFSCFLCRPSLLLHPFSLSLSHRGSLMCFSVGSSSLSHTWITHTHTHANTHICTHTYTTFPHLNTVP